MQNILELINEFNIFWSVKIDDQIGISIFRQTSRFPWFDSIVHHLVKWFSTGVPRNIRVA